MSWPGSRLLGGLAVVCGGLVSASASANGRMPGANDLALNRGTSSHLLARATYGLVQSFDAGESWSWVCEQAIDVSGVVADPPVALMGDGSVVLLPPTGSALVSRDQGCSWSRAPAPLHEQRGVDLTLHPADAAHLFVLTSTIADIDEQGFGAYANLLVETRDHAQSWTLLATLPTDFEAETVEVAAADPQRIYVSGTASENPRLGVLLRSEDGGASWIRSTLDLPAGTGSLFVSAIHPSDADTLWVRVPARGDTLGILRARLYVSSDKGQTFEQIAATKQGMFGFALSPDGQQLAYGGPGDGLYVGPSDGSAFVQVSRLGVRCLRWSAEDALFACATEPQDDFSVGVSRDGGKSFRPLYRMVDTCPQECASGSSFALSCEEAWSTTRPFIEASGAMCKQPWAAPPAPPDAGQVGPAADAAAPPAEAGLPGGRDGGGASTPARRADGGCALGATGSRSGASLVSFAVLLLALVLRSRLRRALVATLGLLLLPGCGDGDNEGDTHAHPAHDAAVELADAADYRGCDALPAFELGMRTRGDAGRLEAELLAAAPAPPARYLNDWTVQLRRPDGTAVADALLEARPFMPLHGHDGMVQPEISILDESGRFRIERLNLHMRGAWEVQLDVRSASAGDDYLVFHVCITE